MIRERIDIRGVVRPLEPEDQLTAFQLPPDTVGRPSELTMRRYLNGKKLFDKKFASVSRKIQKNRSRHIERSKQDTVKNMLQLSNHIHEEKQVKEKKTKQGIVEGLQSVGSWSWSWVLDPDERPPPSSIVSRRDTEEAVQLARIADQSVIPDDNLSGNYLWGSLMNFLTAGPEGSTSSDDGKKISAPGLFGRLVAQKKKPSNAQSMQYFDDLDLEAALNQGREELYDRNF